MRKYWHSWLLFAFLSAAIVAGMGWITARVIQLNGENVEARRAASYEESVRNALWQMDAAISPLILEEVSRPYSDYWNFNGRGEVFNDLKGQNAQFAQPSPLAVTNNAGRNLYFQAELSNEAGQNAKINSPQVFEKEELSIYTNFIDLSDFDLTGNSQQLSALNKSVSVQELEVALQNAGEANELLQIENSAPSFGNRDDSSIAEQVRPQQTGPQQAIQQADQSRYEYAQRQSGAEDVIRKVQSSKSRLYNWGKAKDGWGNYARDADKADEVKGPISVGGPLTGLEEQAIAKVSEEVMRPFWVRDLLMLARRVKVDEKEVIQGVWLNWDSIRTQLLARVQSTFPQADLVKADPAMERDKSRLLASLPVKLVPGDPAGGGIPGAASLVFPLSVAWIAVVAGLISAGVLIVGVSMLSERRGAFVSAVTHELRTPLTTFRMYTEMLKEGIIKDEAKKREYVDTLHSESERLGHLVENVLAYARLEKGTGSRTLEEVPVVDMMERAGRTLRRRTEEAGMDLVVDISDAASGCVLRTDVTAVEQMLFNLVDNSCKYAGKAEDKRIHVAVTVANGEVLFRVCDHGAGLRSDERKSVFRPFMKSAEKAAQTAPGVGLGLALCRRLARQLSGDVGYEDHKGYGACFVLSLPVFRA